MNKPTKFLAGFTIIELLVVVTIMAILTGIGAVSYQNSVKLSRDSRRKTDIEMIRQALETYRAENGTYPANTGLLDPTYITTVPVDPKDSSAYSYSFVSSTSYRICEDLETATGTGAGCAANYDYVVTQP